MGELVLAFKLGDAVVRLEERGGDSLGQCRAAESEGDSVGDSEGESVGASVGAAAMQPARPGSTNKPPEQAVQVPAASQAVHSAAVAAVQQLSPAQSPAHSAEVPQELPSGFLGMQLMPLR